MTNKIINQKGNVLLIVMIIIAIIFGAWFVKEKYKTTNGPTTQAIKTSEDLSSASAELDNQTTTEMDNEIKVLGAESSAF